MSSGSEIYSLPIWSFTFIEEETMGCPIVSTIAWTILLSGIRIPIVFLRFSKILGILLLIGKIKVYGPGKTDFINLKISLGIGLVYSLRIDKLDPKNEKVALLKSIFLILEIFSTADLLNGLAAKA